MVLERFHFLCIYLWSAGCCIYEKPRQFGESSTESEGEDEEGCGSAHCIMGHGSSRHRQGGGGGGGGGGTAPPSSGGPHAHWCMPAELVAGRWGLQSVTVIKIALNSPLIALSHCIPWRVNENENPTQTQALMQENQTVFTIIMLRMCAVGRDREGRVEMGWGLNNCTYIDQFCLFLHSWIPRYRLLFIYLSVLIFALSRVYFSHFISRHPQWDVSTPKRLALQDILACFCLLALSPFKGILLTAYHCTISKWPN